MFKKSVYIPNKANTIPKKREYSVERINIERAKRIENELKILVQSGNDLQNNYTPPEICDMMLDKLDLTGNKSILVLYTIEILFELRKLKYKGQVTFFTQSLSKKELAEKLLPGVIVQYIDIEENPLYFMENNWPEKFDIIVANPPFNKSLHLKFLERCMELSNRFVSFVQPASFLVETKGAHKIFSSTRELIKEVVNDITLFNGNGVFEIQLFVPCSIITIDKKTPTDKINVSNLIYNNIKKIDRHEIHEISLFGYREEINSISKKVLSKNYKNLLSAATVMKDEILPSPDMFTVGFGRMMGHRYNGGGIKDKLHKENFFTFIPKSKFDSCIRDSNKEFSKKGYEIWFEFKTLKEATNFRNFLTTYFARACLATIKFAQSLYAGELKGIPYLDFTQEWTDEKLYKHFNITEEEQAFIKKIIPPYYD